MAGLTSPPSPSTAPAGQDLAVRRLDNLGHFVGDLERAVPGSYTFTITGDATDGTVIAGVFPIPVR